MRELIDEFNENIELFVKNIEDSKKKSNNPMDNEKVKIYQLLINQLQKALDESNSKNDRNKEMLFLLNKDSEKKINEYQNEIKDLKMKVEKSDQSYLLDKYQQVNIFIKKFFLF